MKSSNNMLNNLINRKKETQSNKTLETGLIKEGYVSVVDYSGYELEAEQKEKLVECEKQLVHHGQEMQKNLFYISEALYNAQSIFANNKNGQFYRWFESLGFKKDFVYRSLKKYSLYVRYDNKKAVELPDRVVKEIIKLEAQIKPEEIHTLIEAEKPSEALKEVKEKILSHSATISSPPIAQAELADSSSEAKRLKQINREISELKRRIKELEEEKSAIQKKLENKDNLKFEI